MKRYTLLNRRKSTDARNDADFVTWMRKNDLQNFNTNAEFMAAYALRKATFEKIILRSDSEENFAEDLVNANLLTKETPKKSIFGRLQKS